MFDWLFGSRKQAASQSRSLLSGDRSAEAIPLRVLMITHDPILEAHGGRRLHTHFGWHDPDTLAEQYRADLAACSGGAAAYTIVERHVVDGYPAKIDGFRYHDTSYLDCWQRRGGFHDPDSADYERLLAEFGVVEQILRNAIDEVWLFGFPYAGYYESRMIGAGAVWCNAPPLSLGAACSRRFVVMGFNYERDVGCMLENFGHRVESIMSHVYRNQRGERNLWERFTRYDQSAPGRAECGNVHFAPSSMRDYDWGNQRVVQSKADAWYNFPDLSAPARPIAAGEWGHGDMRGHHLWWLDHLPRVAGNSDGIANNWWQYVLRPDRYLD
ncbi:MAG: hypothetical protein HC822_03400 [Oscillochloris sp.]|nr:hypothetical protein [Oscillochloris sp.]